LTSGAEEEFMLYVNTTGHELYAFVNGELAGYQHSVNGPYIFQFQAPVTMRAGKNYISLLSATVGLKVLVFTNLKRSSIFFFASLLFQPCMLDNFPMLKQNYGASFELMPAGIVGGPVKLVRPDSSAIDLSHSTWTYEVLQDSVDHVMSFS
jgi:hypothetical protein